MGKVYAMPKCLESFAFPYLTAYYHPFGKRSLIRNLRASTAIKNIMLLVASYFNHFKKSMFK